MNIFNTIFFKFIAISCFVVFMQCDNATKPIDKAKLNTNIASFNEDSAYLFIQQQVDFGPRVLSSESHKKCSSWLVSQFEKYGLIVQVQEAEVTTFDGRKHIINNIIAQYKPEIKQRIFISAHWDSRPFADQDNTEKNKPILAANDGGSGVGVILELARLLHKTQKNTGVDFFLWDAEDYGQPEDGGGFSMQEDTWCLGSQYWSKNKKPEHYTAQFGINLDMVAGRNATFTMEGTSMTYAPEKMRYVWDLANELGYSSYFVTQRTNDLIDDHLYINKIAKIPTIDIIHRDLSTQSGFWKHWHTHNDNMENVDKKSIKAVGETVWTVLLRNVLS